MVLTATTSGLLSWLELGSCAFADLPASYPASLAPLSCSSLSNPMLAFQNPEKALSPQKFLPRRANKKIPLGLRAIDLGAHEDDPHVR